MGQEIAIRDDGFAVAERGGTNLIKGILTKFSDRVYRANKTEIVQQAPDGPAFVVAGIVTAWVTWRGGKPSHKVTHNGRFTPTAKIWVILIKPNGRSVSAACRAIRIATPATFIWSICAAGRLTRSLATPSACARPSAS